jgi:sugar phosphate isomerase/epimerase
MIRPAVITDEISQDFPHALDVMLEYGVRDAELRGLWGTNVMDLSPEQLQDAKRALDERGMQVCSIASPIYKCRLRPEGAEADGGPLHLATERPLSQQLSLLEHAVELCRYFNTDLIRVFSFWKQGEVTAELVREIVAAIEPGVRLAERAGVVLGLENEHACILGTGAEAAQALAALESTSFRAVWDPGNAFFAGERPYPDGFEAIRPYLAHVHVKDAAMGPDGASRWTVVGEGEIDYPGQIAALIEGGYTGPLSLETHYKPENGNAEAGSRACLEGLVRLLREAGVTGWCSRAV